MREFLILHKETLLTAVRRFHLVIMPLMGIGGIMVMIFKWYLPVQFAICATAVASWLIFWGCPLRTLKDAIRNFGNTRIEADTRSYLVRILETRFGFDPLAIAATVVLWLASVFLITLYIGCQISPAVLVLLRR